jgi:hypothetical protein
MLWYDSIPPYWIPPSAWSTMACRAAFLSIQSGMPQPCSCVTRPDSKTASARTDSLSEARKAGLKGVSDCGSEESKSDFSDWAGERATHQQNVRILELGVELQDKTPKSVLPFVPEENISRTHHLLKALQRTLQPLLVLVPRQDEDAPSLPWH